VSDFAQSVKQQADIVKVIGDYVRLKKAGAQNYSGLCPFHKEKTASFSVHATRQFFHCFGCGVSGDVFSFVGKIENVGFLDSVKIVAQKCGIPLPKREYNSPEEAKESHQRGKLLELQERATAWFEEQLRSPEGAAAREYLAGRGVKPETIARFRIGFAPDNFNALRDLLAPVADQELLRLSGLFSWKDQEDGTPGHLYSRFRKRVVFPISNESGRVIAFTARALETGEKAGPKYLNSPETLLYLKGQVLFNLDKAKQAIRQYEFALLVEGQMDCISVFTAGIQNVIATSGTAFTELQVNLLKRFTSQVVVNFDPDNAGENATEKSISLLTEEGFTVKIVTLEDGLDPDRFIRERGTQAYMSALRNSRRLSDYLIERARTLFPGSSPEVKLQAMNYLLPHIRRIPNPLHRGEFVADAAQKLAIDSAILREELRQAALKRRERVTARVSVLTEIEKILLRVLCTESEDSGYATICAELSTRPAQFQHLTSYPTLELLRQRQGKDPMAVVEDAAQRALLAQVLIEERESVSEEEAQSAVDTLRVQYLERRQRALRAEIAAAERRGDIAQVAQLSQEKLAIDRDLRSM
jgi:DNA primase